MRKVGSAAALRHMRSAPELLERVAAALATGFCRTVRKLRPWRLASQAGCI